MDEQLSDRVTTTVATIAAVNPWWMLHIENALSISLSSLGVIWLLVQIFYKVKNGK